MVKISAATMKQIQKKFDGGQTKHKYNAKRSRCIHHHDHDSRKEAMWCVKLHQEQKEGKLRNLFIEPIYDLRVNGVVVGKHIPDFEYEMLVGASWRVCVLDVKGILLPLWKLKHAIFCAIYPEINYKIV